MKAILTRTLWVRLHRWAGLVMAGFLILAGLTGSLMAFYPELERALNPHYYPQPPRRTSMDLASLIERAESLAPEAEVEGVWLRGFMDTTVVWVFPKDPEQIIGFNQLILDPATGQELGRRQFGDLSGGVGNLMSFIYEFHYSLAMSSYGIWILGICALIWTIDCFVGFYLTFPVRPRPTEGQRDIGPSPLSPQQMIEEKSSVKGDRQPVGPRRSWWTRWKPAWKVCRTKSRYRLHVDLHRASGLWLWPVFLIFAWSGVYMNLSDTVYTWTTQAVWDYKAPWTELPEIDDPVGFPRLSWREAQVRGEQLMAELARDHGFTIESASVLRLDQARGVYGYEVRSSLDFQGPRRSFTQVFFDASTGEHKLTLLPSGQHTGNTITNWLISLHEANVFGLPYRMSVSAVGLMTVMLSLTGVVIWLKKRRSRQIARMRNALTPPVSATPALQVPDTIRSPSG